MKKELLFFITLLLAITPACKKNKKHHNLSNAHLAITAGSLEIATGLSLFTPIIPTAMIYGAAFVWLTLIPGILIAGGIYTLTWGLNVKNEIEQEPKKYHQTEAHLNENLSDLY